MAPGQVSKLHEIPFLDASQLNSGRFLSCLTFYVDGVWRLWVKTSEEESFVEMQAWPAEAFYFAQAAEQDGDFTSVFLNLFAQRANVPSLARAFQAFHDDLFNLSASLNKLRVIHASSSDGSARMAATEVEYILLICRSMFDLLQEMLAALWDAITLSPPPAQKRQLKQSFADMALRGNQVRSAQELKDRYGLTEALAECYARHAPLFVKIRDFRDNLVHRGHKVPTIFNGDGEFLIARDLGPFRDLNIWRDEELLPNELAPLAPALGLMINGVLLAADDFAKVLSETITFPPPMAPDLAFFCRGYFNTVLVDTLMDAGTRMAEGRFLLDPDSL